MLNRIIPFGTKSIIHTSMIRFYWTSRRPNCLSSVLFNSTESNSVIRRHRIPWKKTAIVGVRTSRKSEGWANTGVGKPSDVWDSNCQQYVPRSRRSQTEHGSTEEDLSYNVADDGHSNVSTPPLSRLSAFCTHTARSRTIERRQLGNG